MIAVYLDHACAHSSISYDSYQRPPLIASSERLEDLDKSTGKSHSSTSSQPPPDQYISTWLPKLDNVGAERGSDSGKRDKWLEDIGCANIGIPISRENRWLGRKSAELSIDDLMS